MVPLIFGLLAAAVSPTLGLQLLPPPRTINLQGGEELTVGSAATTVYLESTFATKSDTDGLSLIPPTARQFAETFVEDLNALTKTTWTLRIIDKLANPDDARGIILGAFSGDASKLAYEDGTASSEAYELSATANSVSIRGTGARGMWWGTRTLLQHLLLQNGTIAQGSITDAPAHKTRGFMLDAGRKWYAPSFLKDLCTYASFFKMSEFHYHLSDNYPLNRGHNKTWQNIYTQFSLMPQNETLKGLVPRPNETLSRADFEDFQSHCASRGVTVIPEIEAPGHCLYITKWKPHLSLPKRDLLNLSHPETIPTVKGIWTEFLPWFQTKEVHIGADEYDATLADVYINFVNEMSRFVNSTSGKRVRIWGTLEPSKNFTISKDVIIQHWQLTQDDPVQLLTDGYDLINSQDWWGYMSLKSDHTPILPAPYPQFFNETRTLNFANVPGWQWQPTDVNPYNVTMQFPVGKNNLHGAIMAAWNDNGPDASTQLEAYYAMRRGIPLTAARAWSGTLGPNVTADTAASTIDFFSPRAPAQNLDRVRADVSWKRTGSGSDQIQLGYGSKGVNYTLTLGVSGPFKLEGPDTTLELRSDGKLVYTSDGWPYPLRTVAQKDALELDPGHPGRIWVNVSSSSHEEVKVSTPATITIATDVVGGSRVWLDGNLVGRFEVYVFGGRNTQHSWSQMALVAPLQTLSGGVESLSLQGVVKIPGPTPVTGSGIWLGIDGLWLAVLCVLATGVLWL